MIFIFKMVIRSMNSKYGIINSETSCPTGSRLFKTLRSGGTVKCGAALQRLRHTMSCKTLAAEENVQKYLDSIEQADASLNSYITVDREGALSQAKSIDRRVANGEDVGPLAGVPMAIKDNICTVGVPTTAGSHALKGYTPPYDATAVSRLRAAGAIIIGKSNMDEFGMGSTTENSAYQPTRNPWDLARVPGGSSGGSASAVAASLCVSALGSDTGGSIRQPAHFCGVVGIKPSYGRVSRSGLIAYASSLDVIGPMAASVADAAEVLAVIAGHDSADATCSRRSVPDYSASLLPVNCLRSLPLAGRRVALVKETSGEGVDPKVDEAVRSGAKHMESLGATVEEVSLPTYPLGLPAYYVIALSEASSNLSRYDGVLFGHRPAEAAELQELYIAARRALGGEVRRRILMGTYALSAGYYDAYYKRAQQVRTLVASEMNAALATYNVLLTPVAPTVAYKLGEKSADPLAMYKGDLMTVNVNLAGLPAVSVPCGFVEEEGTQLPVGLQLIGRPFGEQELLEIAHIYELTSGVANISAPPFRTASTL